VPYGDDAALAGALLRVLEDRSLRERLAAAGIARAATFSWPACGAASLDALTAGLPPWIPADLEGARA